MSDRRFDHAGDLLKQAQSLIDDAARVIAEEAAKAPSLMKEFHPHRDIGPGPRPPALCSLEELTSTSVEVARLANQVGMYAEWTRYTGEPT